MLSTKDEAAILEGLAPQTIRHTEPDGSTSILSRAHELTHGDRFNAYGHPADDYAKVAKMVTGVLLAKLRPGVEITPIEATMIMECVKISRQVNRPAEDNAVDGAGYWWCAEAIRRRDLASGAGGA
jgi:Domain of unknown function (DUF6378)